jgi:hypothetical protein
VLFFTRLIAIRTDPPLVTRSVSCDPPDTLQIDGPAPIPCVGKPRLSRLNLRLFHFETGYLRSFFFVLHFLLFVLHFHLRIPVLCSLCDPGWPEEAAHNPQYHGVCAQGHRRIRIRERSTLFYIGESRKSAHQGAGTSPLLFEMPVYVLVYRLIFLLAICFGLFLDLFFLLAICLLYVFFWAAIHQDVWFVLWAFVRLLLLLYYLQLRIYGRCKACFYLLLHSPVLSSRGPSLQSGSAHESKPLPWFHSL